MENPSLATLTKGYLQLEKMAYAAGNYLASQRSRHDYAAIGSGIVLGGAGLFDNSGILSENVSWLVAFPSYLIPAVARLYDEGKRKYKKIASKEDSRIRKLKNGANAFMTGAMWTSLSLLETTVTASLVVHYSSQLIQKL